jgi:exodeoxyribonuclease VII large subunit
VARLETSAESPVPVRVVAIRIGEWIARLGEIWVDGQIAQLTRRPGVATQFLTLRDPDANISMRVTCGRGVLPDSVSEGTRVVIRARPDFYLERGDLTLRATEVRQVGLGELLARLEALRKLLAAEGLFALDRKRPLPFLPGTIGLITGRAGAAERDVVENARRRLPGARFRLENVAMQGVNAVTEVVDALRRLDADPEVAVIVIAIGHETDRPLLDLVADVAASTPTDAGKRIVPDLAEERRTVAELRDRARACIRTRVARERELMAGLPERLRRTVRARLDREAEENDAFRERVRHRVRVLVEAARSDLEHVRAQVRTLSPQATLDRGYAVVRRAADGTVVRAPDDAIGPLRVRVAGGEFGAAAT